MNKIIVDSENKQLSLNIKELFHYKDLFLTLAYRDLRVRYAQTFLGLLWAILQPVITLIIFTIIFSKALNVDTGEIPYPLFAMAGMSAWTYFAFVMNQSGSSIIGAQQMVKKIYFPRLVIPLSKAIVGFVDFGIAIIFLIALMIYYQYVPSKNIILLPLIIVFNITAALAIGIWLSALTIRYRDFQHVVPFLVQIGLYATPIYYPISLLPEKYQLLFFLNPMAGIVQGYRWCLFGGESMNMYTMLSFVLIVFLFISGLFYFRKIEKIMADIV